MKIAIIGFGWLGKPLGESLLKKGHDMVGTTTSGEKLNSLRETGLEAIQLDITQDIPQNSTVFFDNTDVCILNFPPQRAANPQGMETEVQDYGSKLLKAANMFGESTRFIFTSSTGIYPDALAIATEAAFDRTKFLETNSMAFAEESLHQKLGQRLTIVRMAGLIGGDRHIGKYFAGKKNIPNGDTPVNLIHLSDCIRIIEQIIEQACWGETFNACASEHPSRRDFYTAYCEKAGLEKPGFPEEEKPIIGKQIDNSKSREILDFEYLFKIEV